MPRQNCRPSTFFALIPTYFFTVSHLCLRSHRVSSIQLWVLEDSAPSGQGRQNFVEGHIGVCHQQVPCFLQQTYSYGVGIVVCV